MIKYPKFTFVYTAIASMLCAMACTSTQMNLEADRTEISRIELTPESLHIVEGKTATIGVKLIPWNSENTPIHWTSTDEKVAQVNDNGKVTAITPGQTDIIVAAGDKSAICQVTVESSHIPAIGITIVDKQPLSLMKGSGYQLQAALNPVESTEIPKWSSSNAEVCEVRDNGYVKAKAPGQATLKVEVPGYSDEITILVHDNLWVEQTDALDKPVSFVDFDYSPQIIRVARGETATFQGIIYAKEPCSNINIEVTKFSADETNTIALPSKIFYVKDIRCSEHWDSWAGGKAPDAYPSNEQYIPDPLIPLEEERLSLTKDQKKAFWVEFNIPHDFPSGDYSARISLSSSSISAEYEFMVKVYDVTLPKQQSMDVIQWIHKDTRAMNNGQPVDMYANYQTFIPEIVKMLNAYGQNSYQLLYSDYHSGASVQGGAELDPSTGHYRMKYTFNNVYWDRDFQFFDNLCEDLHQIHGLNFNSGRDYDKGTISVTGIKNDPKGGILVKDGSPVYTTVTFPTEDAEQIAMAENFICNYFYQLQEYLRKRYLKDGRSYLDVYVQTICDEPRGEMYKAYNQIAAMLRKAAPDIKTLDPIETDKINPELLDYPCPVLDKVHINQAQGNQQQWLYTCMQPQGGFANRLIRIPLFKTRLVHWIQFKYNAVGYLHWGPNYWRGAPNEDPWQDAYGSYIGGDMWIIWPGDHKVYPSIRLSAMRDGIRDYELLRMIEKISPAKAEEICAKVVTDNAHYNMDLNNFREARKLMLEYLENNN